MITFAVGHLVELIAPEEYDERFKKWRMDDLPIIPDEFRLHARDKKAEKQLKVIHKLLQRDDVDRVVNACDAGREGELIFAYIYETSGVDKPVERLWISSLTKTGDQGGLRAAPARRAAAPARGRRALALGGRLARRHERHARSDDPRPRVGRRRRLARPRADADAGAAGQARARDPGVRPRAVLARPRRVRPSLPGSVVRGRRDAAEGGEARRRDRREGLGQGRPGRVGRAQGAVRARAAPLRPHLAPARREPTLRLLGAPHAAGRAVALRGQEGDHVPANELALALGRPRPAAEADRRHAPADRRVRRGRALRPRAAAAAARRASSTTRRSSDHHAIIPTDVEHDVSRFSPDERRIFDLSRDASSRSSTRRPATRGRRS